MSLNGLGNLSRNKCVGVFAVFLVVGVIYYFNLMQSPQKSMTMQQLQHFSSLNNRAKVLALQKNSDEERYLVLADNKTDAKVLALRYNKNEERVLALRDKNNENLKSLEHANENDFIPDPDHEFLPLNSWTGGVKTYHHVCLERMPGASLVTVDTNRSVFEKRIVIYDSYRDFDTELLVAKSPSVNKPNSWPVTFSKSSVPAHMPIMPFPAYFVTASSPGNLYHLMHDTLSGLYGVLRDTNRLNSTVKNQVYTRKVLLDNITNKNISRYGNLIRALGVRSFPSYHAAPVVCYPYGVFGWRPVDLQEVAGYLVKKLNYNDNECPKGPALVTFIERQYRKVINMEAMVDVANSLGLKTQRIYLEKLSVYDQYVTIRCTDVLVGVQGAGLQWAMFLRPNRAMIELYYPGWEPLFSNDFRYFRGMIVKKVFGVKDGAQWDFLRKLWNKKKPYTEEEMKHFDQPKFMDSKYDINEFQEALHEIFLKMQGFGVG